jgi:hypothetical protein
MENTEKNCEVIWKILKKIVKSEKIWKIWKKSELKCEMIGKIWKKGLTRLVIFL